MRRKPTKAYNFLTANPDLINQWHPIKNGSLKPQDITPYSTKMIWWLCESGHEWQTRAYTRTRGAGCPFCAGKRMDELPLNEWFSRNRSLGFGKAFRKVKDVPSGSVLVEIPLEAWQNLAIATLSPEDIGNLILEYRRREGLTQKQFAQMIGRHRNYLSDIEKGNSDRITFDTYQKIMSFVLK